jgi:hypothetical protein
VRELLVAEIEHCAFCGHRADIRCGRCGRPVCGDEHCAERRTIGPLHPLYLCRVCSPPVDPACFVTVEVDCPLCLGSGDGERLDVDLYDACWQCGGRGCIEVEEYDAEMASLCATEPPEDLRCPGCRQEECICAELAADAPTAAIQEAA